MLKYHSFVTRFNLQRFKNWTQKMLDEYEIPGKFSYVAWDGGISKYNISFYGDTLLTK